MKGQIVPVFMILIFVGKVWCSAIPIWEMLTYQEKMGRLMYAYVHLVERYCKKTSDQDCRKVMTLHGISNLLNYDEHTLDLLDPDQRNASRLIWQAATKSQYKYPVEKSQDQDTVKLAEAEDYEMGSNKAASQTSQTVIVPAPKFLRRRIWIR